MKIIKKLMIMHLFAILFFFYPAGAFSTDFSFEQEFTVFKVEFDFPNKVNKQNLSTNYYGDFEKCVALDWNNSMKVDLTNYLYGDWAGNLGDAKDDLQWRIRREINGEWQVQDSCTLNYGNEPADKKIKSFYIEVKLKNESEILDRLILVLVPQSTSNDFKDWVNVQDPEWLEKLPSLYSSINITNSVPIDPEKSECDPPRWKNDIETHGNNYYYHPNTFAIRSEVTEGGHGHQACYNRTSGALIRTGISVGSADKAAPSWYSTSHRNQDVRPFIWAAQLDGNPVQANSIFAPTNLTGPMLYKGNDLNNYFGHRPTIANNKPELIPGVGCSQ